jgi:hypothetical protein
LVTGHFGDAGVHIQRILSVRFDRDTNGVTSIHDFYDSVQVEKILTSNAEKS